MTLSDHSELFLWLKSRNFPLFVNRTSHSNWLNRASSDVSSRPLTAYVLVLLTRRRRVKISLNDEWMKSVSWDLVKKPLFLEIGRNYFVPKPLFWPFFINMAFFDQKGYKTIFMNLGIFDRNWKKRLFWAKRWYFKFICLMDDLKEVNLGRNIDVITYFMVSSSLYFGPWKINLLKNVPKCSILDLILHSVLF